MIAPTLLPPAGYAALLRDAESHYRGGDLPAARAALEAALALAADDAQRADVLGDLAVVAVATGDLDEATRRATDALACEPGHDGALFVLAHCRRAAAEEAR